MPLTQEEILEIYKIREIDPSTGILLTPSFHGKKCRGSGLLSVYECCCGACDYYLACFPEWNLPMPSRNIHYIKNKQKG